MRFLDALERIALAICMFIIIIGVFYFASISGGNAGANEVACKTTTGSEDCNAN